MEERSNEAPDPSPLETCMRVPLFGATFVRLTDDGSPVPLDAPALRRQDQEPRPRDLLIVT